VFINLFAAVERSNPEAGSLGQVLAISSVSFHLFFSLPEPVLNERIMLEKIFDG